MKPDIEAEMEKDIQRAIKAARPHLLKAWASAKELGQSRPFSEWIDGIFSEGMEKDLGAETNHSPATAGMLTRARSWFN